LQITEHARAKKERWKSANIMVKFWQKNFVDYGTVLGHPIAKNYVRTPYFYRTFKRVLHVDGKQTPLDGGAHVTNIQLLRKPAKYQQNSLADYIDMLLLI